MIVISVFFSPLPLNLLSEMAQHLTKLSLTELISALPLHLMFIRHAATCPQINPIVSYITLMLWLHVFLIHLCCTTCQVLLQLLSRVLSGSSLCEQGPWDIGNTLLDICTIVLRTHHTETVFRGTIIKTSTCIILLCLALLCYLDISDLLQLIAQEYGDLDIEDRARFYHQLLLTVSGEKVMNTAC